MNDADVTARDVKEPENYMDTLRKHTKQCGKLTMDHQCGSCFEQETMGILHVFSGLVDQLVFIHVRSISMICSRELHETYFFG